MIAIAQKKLIKETEIVSELRDYQRDLYFAIKDEFAKKNKSVIAQLPTGGGKSKIIAKIVFKAWQKGSKILFVAHRGEIIKQIRQHLISSGIDKSDIGVIQGPNSGTWPFTPFRPIQVSMIQSITQNWDRWKVEGLNFNFDLIIIDESHVATSDSYVTLFNNLPKAYKIGFTATPEPPYGKTFKNVFDAIVCGASHAELITMGYLPKIVYYATQPPELDDIQTYNGDYVSNKLQAKVNTKELRGKLVETWVEKVQKHYGNLPTIVFAAGVNHSKEIVDDYNNAGISAVHIDGKMGKNERREALRKFISGEAYILSNCDVLTEGFDLETYCEILELPSISVGCVQLASPTKRITKANQRRGRARGVMVNGIKTAIYLDHAGIIDEHGMPDDPHLWTLDGVQKSKPQTKRCPEEEKDFSEQWGCGRADIPISEQFCPHCGFEFDLTKQIAERKEGSKPKKLKQNKQVQLELIETSLSQRFISLVQKSNNYQWAFEQLGNFSPDYEELYWACKKCVTKDGKPFKITAAFIQWVRGQKIVNGYRWKPSEEDLFYVMGFLLDKGERPGNTFKAWVGQCRKVDQDFLTNIQEAYILCSKVAEFCDYSPRWITDTVDRLTQPQQDDFNYG